MGSNWDISRRVRWQAVGAIALLVIFLGVGRAWAQAPGMIATVDYAKSGQTLELLSELSTQMPVMDIRLAGIQAPDMEQTPWGPEARQCLSTLAEGQIRVEPQAPTPDRYNRLWAYVWADGQLVNAAVLAQGCAVLASDRLPQQRYGAQLVYAQEAARLLGYGIWAPENPLRETPDAFRQIQASP
ncbi:MAG: thermonuclease family protein [Leptolyngbya sp. SIO1E4]|nr:thermonuclease family protein [Leptolyngbya sp. SIO1E4]